MDATPAFGSVFRRNSSSMHVTLYGLHWCATIAAEFSPVASDGPLSNHRQLE